jgi:hypothetical protein
MDFGFKTLLCDKFNPTCISCKKKDPYLPSSAGLASTWHFIIVMRLVIKSCDVNATDWCFRFPDFQCSSCIEPGIYSEIAGFSANTSLHAAMTTSDIHSSCTSFGIRVQYLWSEPSFQIILGKNTIKLTCR